MAHKVGRWIKKEIGDDILGIDADKTFGIPNDTFVGGALSKVTPMSPDSIWDSAGDFLQEKVYDPLSGKKAEREAEAQMEAQRRAIAESEAAAMGEIDTANRRGLASNLLSRGKGSIFDPSDALRLKQFLASPGDKDWTEGFSQGGNPLDPFPDYMRKTGDFLMEGLEDASGAAGGHIGSAQDRMSRFGGTYDKLAGLNDKAIGALGDIYDPAGVEARMKGYNSRLGGLLDELKNINLIGALDTAGRQSSVLDAGERYGESLGRSIEEKAGLSSLKHDELDRLPGILRDMNLERTGRYADTRSAMEQTADEMLDAERAKALAARENVRGLAAGGQRALGGAMVGQGTGTASRMGSGMIDATMGRAQSDALSDALIRNAERRGLARERYAGQMEDVLDTRADEMGAKLGGQRYDEMGKINPALADVYRNETSLSNSLRELGFGSPELSALASNIGIDQGVLDDERGLDTALMNMRLANTGMIPGLGMQSAMLPSLYGEAALAPYGPFSRNVSPYTSAGSLPAGQTVFQPSRYTPEPIPKSGGIDWLNVAKQAPEIFKEIKGVFGGENS